MSRSATVPDQFYAWDFGLGTYGGYVLVSRSGGSYTSVPASPSGLNNIIPSGAAILVRSNGTSPGKLTFNESSKATAAGSGSFSNFSTSAAAAPHNLRVDLADGSSNLIDGVMTSFAAGYSNKVDNDDASKLNNFYENIALFRAGKLLTLERRSDITAKDTVSIQLSGVKLARYKLQIDPSDFNEPGITATLEDAYLHTSTKLDLARVSEQSFSIGADTASYKNRFRILLNQPNTADNIAKTSHIGTGVIAFPNPATQKKVNLSFEGMPAGTTTLR